MSSRFGLIALVLFVAGVAVFAVTWLGRDHPTAGGAGAAPAPTPAPAASEADAGGELSAPRAPQQPVEADLVGELEAEAAAERPETPDGEKPLLDQTEADWFAQYGSASPAELATEIEALGARLAEDTKVAIKLRMASGELEVVDASQAAHIDPDDPTSLIGMQRKAPQEGQVQQLVLYPTDAPELYALRSKVQWLQERLASLGDG